MANSEYLFAQVCAGQVQLSLMLRKCIPLYLFKKEKIVTRMKASPG